jgi:hypothetical protein
MKVNDMFGQADQSKKALPFQTQTTHAGWNQVLRSSVRFSNHTATTSSNLTAFWPALGVRFDSPLRRVRNADGRVVGVRPNKMLHIEDMSGPDQEGRRRMRREAIENFIGTLGQNTMFQLIKPRILLPVIGAILTSGDDDDEEIRNAIAFSDAIMTSDEDANVVERFVKSVLFGNGSSAIKSWRDEESAKRSAMADVLSKVMLEVAQGVPGVGVLAGYMPVSNTLLKPTTDPLSEWLMTLGTDLNVAKDNYSKKGVRIYDRPKNALEFASQLTAPTMALYGYGNAAYTSLNAIGVDDVTYTDQIALWASQIISTREFRSKAESDVRESARLKNMRERNR